jgi:hypothetical protein
MVALRQTARATPAPGDTSNHRPSMMPIVWRNGRPARCHCDERRDAAIPRRCALSRRLLRRFAPRNDRSGVSGQSENALTGNLRFAPNSAAGLANEHSRAPLVGLCRHGGNGFGFPLRVGSDECNMSFRVGEDRCHPEARCLMSRLAITAPSVLSVQSGGMRPRP